MELFSILQTGRGLAGEVEGTLANREDHLARDGRAGLGIIHVLRGDVELRVPFDRALERAFDASRGALALDGESRGAIRVVALARDEGGRDGQDGEHILHDVLLLAGLAAATRGLRHRFILLAGGLHLSFFSCVGNVSLFYFPNGDVRKGGMPIRRLWPLVVPRVDVIPADAGIFQ